jgi:hypothetical protein
VIKLNRCGGNSFEYHVCTKVVWWNAHKGGFSVVVNVEGVATLLGYLWQARGCCNAADKNHTQSDDYG